jgi:quinol-cytochrome oxidoreductase complex cytochrome b subunit
VFFIPNYLNHADNYIEFNPLVTPAHIVPEWYYLPFYAILRSIPDKLGGVIAMFMAIVLLAFLPWLDTSKVKSASYRPYFKIAFWIFVLDAVVLGFIGSQPPEGSYVIWGQILTAYYFLHLLVITPLLGLFEKPLPMPASIAEAVLGKAGSAAAISAHAASSPNTKG